MKILKWIFIVLIGLIVLLLVIAAFQPSQKEFTNSVVVNSSPRIPYTLVNSLKNWEKWSPFQEGDTAMVVEYTGPDAGEGATMTWKSKVQGDGSMTIVNTVYDQKVTYLLDFGYDHKDSTWFVLERVPEGTKVSWISKFDEIGYPMSRLMWLMMGGMMETTFQKGLDKLKSVVESMPADCKTSEITEFVAPAKTYIALTDTISMEEMSSFFGNAYGMIGQYIGSKRLTMTGMPVAFFNGDPWHPTWIITAAMPVAKAPQKLEGGLFVMNMAEQKVVSASHFGSYETSPDTYYKIEDYMKEKGLSVGGIPWEEYVNDPSTVTDPMQIETKIFFPVK